MRKHHVAGFFLIAFAVSWAIWVPMALSGVRIHESSAWPSQMPGLIGPSVAAVAMSALGGGWRSVRDLASRMARWRVRLHWYFAALSPLALFGLASVASAATGGGWPRLDELGMFSGLPLVAAPVMCLLLFVAAYAEETGWRGYALPEMLRKTGFLTTSVVIGCLWALWHTPLVFAIQSYREMGVGIVPMLTLGLVSGSIVLAWLYRASGGSILIVALWHGTYNLVSGTAAAHGLAAAVVSSAVMIWAVVIGSVEVRKWLRSRRAPVELKRAGARRATLSARPR